ncbi:MAG: helix-turn-helix domain-containing protein, partial [[Clostridium] innocuum]
RQTISNWELNETVPDARQLLALSQALNISMDALVDNEERPVQTPEIQDMESRPTQRQSKKLTVLLSVIILLLVLAFISAS